jgi:hypothetical protein
MCMARHVTQNTWRNYGGRQNVFKARAVVVAMMMVAGPVAWSTSYHVTTTGSDASQGTSGAPWRTLRKANQTLTAGDTVFVHGGTYDETIVPARSGSAGRPIVYMRFGTDPVVVRGESATMKGIVALGWDMSTESIAASKSYVIIDGFVFQYRFASALPDVPVFSNRFAYVHIDNSQSAYNEIRNCVIEQPGGGLANFEDDFRHAGILVGYAQHTRMEGNDISGMWIGIWLCGAAPRYNVIRGNYIHDVGSSAVDIADPETGEDGLQGNLIEWNMISGSANEDGIQFEPNYQSDYSVASNRGTIIRNNIVRGCVENAFDLKGASRIVIEGNIVYANTGDDDGPVGGNDRSGGMGGVIHGGTGKVGVPSATGDVVIRNNIFFDNFGAILVETGYKIYNNTLVANNRDYTGPNSSWRSNPGPGFTGLLAYSNTDCAIKNNIILQHGQNEVSLNVYGMVNADIDYNLYGNTNGARMADAGGALFTQYTLSAWKQRLASRGTRGAEANSIETDPLFVSVPVIPHSNHANLDFRLSSASPAIDRGGALTTVRTSGNGTLLPVVDSRFFHDGYGVTTGDAIVVGTRGSAVITAINAQTHVMTLDHSMSWSAGDPVYRPYNGSAPDMGALEYTSAEAIPVSTPSAVYPATGVTGIDALTPLAWSRVSGAVAYWVQVSTSPGFASPVFERMNICDTTCWGSGLANGTTYYWRIRALSNGTIGSWSGIHEFTTGGSAVPPQKTETNLLANGDFESGSSNWAFYAGGAGTMSIAQSGRQNSYAASMSVTGTGTNIQLYQSGLSLERNTLYAIRFAAYSNSGHDLKISLLQHGAPYASYGIVRHPVDLGTGWKEYLVYVAATLSVDYATDARLQFWFADNATAGDVYVIDDVSLAAVGEVPGLQPPMISSPATGAQGLPTDVAVRWVAVSGAQQYQVQIGTNASFTNVLFDTVLSGETVSASGLLSATTHYLRVRSLQTDGFGTYGSTVQFATGVEKTAVEETEGVPDRMTLYQNYPNPFNPATKIRFALPEASHVRLAVYSALGEEVVRLVDEQRSAGAHEVILDASGLASGMYFYRLQTGSVVETQRMVLVR